MAAPSFSKLNALVEVSRAFLLYEKAKEDAAINNLPLPPLAPFLSTILKDSSEPLSKTPTPFSLLPSPPPHGLPPPFRPPGSDLFYCFPGLQPSQNEDIVLSSSSYVNNSHGEIQGSQPAELQVQPRHTIHQPRNKKRTSSSKAGKKRKAPVRPPLPETGEIPPGPWQEVHEQLGGSPTVWLGEKVITATDTSEHQHRLLLPDAIRNRVYIEAKDDKHKIDDDTTGLPVLVLDWLGGQHQMVCKYRSYAKKHGGGMMVLIGGWKKFVETSGLVVGNRLVVAAFRSEGALCFALIRKIHD